MRKTGLIASVAALGAAFAVTAVAWTQVPPDAQIAIHWNIHGEADRFGGKAEALLMLPAIMAALTVVFAALPTIDPRRANLHQSRRAYTVAWIGAMVLLLVGQCAIAFGAMGVPVPLEAVVVGAGLLFIGLGDAIAKSRSNWFVGIRTPWSLSSEDAWIASNRAAGWGFVATGALTLAALLGGGFQWSAYVLIGGAFASAIMGAGVSYLVWRRGRPA